MRRFLAGAACAAIVLTPVAAQAHSTLEESTPGPGRTVAPGLDSVSLTFSSLGSTDATVTITDPDGRPVPIGRIVPADDTSLCLAVEPLTPGIHTLDYTVVSDDGDTITSAFQFDVAPDADPAEPLPVCDGRDLGTPKTPKPTHSATTAANPPGNDTPSWPLFAGLAAATAAIAGGAVWWLSRRRLH